NQVLTRDRSRAEAYLVRLHRELEMTASLFDRDREVVQLHFDSGTPNFLTMSQLGEVVGAVRRQFRLSARSDTEISIEIDPCLASRDDIAALASIGFNHLSLAVQDFDRDAQGAANRVPSAECTFALTEACRRHGMRSVSVDLIYGLLRQTQEGFRRTLDAVIT